MSLEKGKCGYYFQCNFKIYHDSTIHSHNISERIKLLKPIQQNVVVQMQSCVIWVMAIKRCLSPKTHRKNVYPREIQAFFLPFANATRCRIPQIMATQNYLNFFVKSLCYVCLFKVCQTNLKVGHQWHRWAGCHRRADDVFQIVCHTSGAHHCRYIGTGKGDFKSTLKFFEPVGSWSGPARVQVYLLILCLWSMA